ncbi:MAG: hypothetical protein LRY36_02590 [Alphaproteobacteria bacterium]|nr:hypothetical protein [Alphaproteobacteria bacterium]
MYSKKPNEDDYLLVSPEILNLLHTNPPAVELYFYLFTHPYRYIPCMDELLRDLGFSADQFNIAMNGLIAANIMQRRTIGTGSGRRVLYECRTSTLDSDGFVFIE